MSNSHVFAYLVMFILPMFGLLTLYGVTNAGFDTALNAPYQCLVNDYPNSSCHFPSWNPPTPTNVTATLNQTPWWKCIFSLPCVAASVSGSVGGQSTAQSIWNGFSVFGYGISVFLQDVLVFFVKMGNTVLLLASLTTFLNSTSSGVPFLGFIFGGFIILLVVFAAAIIKPGGHGA